MVFSHATIFDDVLQKESFDVVMAFNILHAVENSGDVLARIAELIKPGGLLLACVPCLKEKMSVSKSLQLFFYSVLIKIGLVPNILTRYSCSEFETFLQNGNFETVRTDITYHGLTSCFFASVKK